MRVRFLYRICFLLNEWWKGFQHLRINCGKKTTLRNSVGGGKCRKLSFLPGFGGEPQRIYFSVMIFFRSAIELFISEEVSSILVTLSQELMIVE